MNMRLFDQNTQRSLHYRLLHILGILQICKPIYMCTASTDKLYSGKIISHFVNWNVWAFNHVM